MYVAGGSFTEPSVAKYWKDGKQIPLSIYKQSLFAHSIIVPGQDVYIAGRAGNQAVYWKNGKAVPLSDGKKATDANAVYVVGNDVYVVGNELSDDRETTTIRYWKNGKPMKLSGDINTEAVSIFVTR